MGAKPIEMRQIRVPLMVVLAVTLLATVPYRVSAADSATPDLRTRKATQRAASTAAASSVEWTASDFAAIGLMFLGAAVVFVPMPKRRSGKSASVPVATAEAVSVGASSGAGAVHADVRPGTIGAAKTLVNTGINPTPVSS